MEIPPAPAAGLIETLVVLFEEEPEDLPVAVPVPVADLVLVPVAVAVVSVPVAAAVLVAASVFDALSVVAAAPVVALSAAVVSSRVSNTSYTNQDESRIKAKGCECHKIGLTSSSQQFAMRRPWPGGSYRPQHQEEAQNKQTRHGTHLEKSDCSVVQLC